MKKGVLLLVLLFTLSYLGWGQRTLPATEQFNYSAGELRTVGTDWTRISGTGNDLLVADGNVTRNGYLAELGRKASMTNGASDDLKLSFTSQSTAGTKVYAAFVLNVLNTTGLGAGAYFTALGSGTTSFASRLFIKSSGSGFALAIARNSNTPSTYSSELAVATNHLIVIGYEIVSGTTNDIASLWINPAISTVLPSADFTIGGTSADLSIDGFMLRQASGSPTAALDDIIVSTSWSDLFLNPTFTSNGNLGAGTYTNLTVSGASSALTLNGNITVNGTFSLSDGSLSLNSNTLTYGGSSVLKYNGSAAQTTTSSELPSSGGPNSLTIDNSSGVNLGGNVTIAGTLLINSGKIFIIGNDKQVTVSGTLTNSAGNTGLVIESGGSLINNTASVGATVKREIASDANWHLLSSPVSGQNICDGNFAPETSHFNSGDQDNYGKKFDFFKWSETAGSLNWINLKNTDWTLNTSDFGATPQFVAKTGYLVNYNGFTGSNTTKTFAGALYNGDQTITLTHSGNTWNLVGNPFPSAIDWSAIDKTNLSENYCYIYNPSKAGGAGYEAQDGGYIAAMQGFFVAASGNSLSIPNSARTHNNSWMKNSSANVENQLNIKLGNMTNYDETVVKFIANGNINKDRSDAFKLFSLNPEIPQVYTVKNDGVNVCINSLPFFAEPFSVPLGMLIPANGNYSIELSGFESFPSVPGILLEDLKTQATQNMVQNPVYSFNATTSDNDNRFILHFSGPIGINEKSAQLSYLIFASGTSLYVVDKTGKNQGNVQVYNMMGQLITAAKMNGNSTLKLNIDVPVGYYIVKVVSAETTQSSKVFMQ